MLTRNRPRRVAAVVVGAVGLVAVVVGVLIDGRHGDGPRIVWPSDSGFGMTVPSQGDPRPWRFGAVNLCLDRPGSVTISSIEPQGGNHQLRVVGFATRPDPALNPALTYDQKHMGADRESLAHAGFPSGLAIVAAACPKTWPERATTVLFYELGTQFQRSGPGPAWATSVRIVYDSDGNRRTITLPWQVKLCGVEGPTTETCHAPAASPDGSEGG
jgi:hypothetical protein